MSKTSFWVSNKLTHEILCFFGNKSASQEQSALMESLLCTLAENSLCEKTQQLSERERTYLFWVACGKTFDEVLLLMNISFSTAMKYRKRIFSKLKCQNMSQAVFTAMRYQSIHCRQ